MKSNVIEWKGADEICTLCADKGYDATAFVAIRALKVTPHIAQNFRAGDAPQRHLSPNNVARLCTGGQCGRDR